MKKNILFLGDGIYTKNLLKYFNDKNFNRYLVDLKILNPRKKKFKKTYETNLLDKKKILKIAKKLKINHVITNQNDFAIPVYGYLCSKLKLKGIPEKICNRFTNKKKCRLYLKKKVSCRTYIPNFYLNYKKIPKNNHKKNFIVKPINMQGSRYVEKVKYNLLNNKINILKKKNINFIIEEYIEGIDYAVESVVNNGLIENLAISKKQKFTNSFVDEKIISKNYTSNKFEKKLLKVNNLIINNLKLKNGLTHLEFRRKINNKIYLIEAACRGAGSGISNIIIPYLTNFNTDKFLYRMSLGLNQTIQNLNSLKRKTVLQWLRKNNSKLLSNKNIIFYKKGLVAKKIQSSKDRGSFIIKKVK